MKNGMRGFWQKWFGGARGTAHAAVHYREYAIHPRPQKTANGWRIEAVIRRPGADGAMREHCFIRADACNSEVGAVALTIHKAKMLIDQQGEKIFS